MPARLHRFANPRRFTRLAQVVHVPSAWMALVVCTAMAAASAPAGFVTLPIIKFSVDWWNRLHSARLRRVGEQAAPRRAAA